MLLPDHIVQSIFEWGTSVNGVVEEVKKMQKANYNGEDYDKETFVMALQESVRLGKQMLDQVEEEDKNKQEQSNS